MRPRNLRLLYFNSHASIPQQGYPLCGSLRPLLQERRTVSISPTTSRVVSIPQQGYPLCGLRQRRLPSMLRRGLNTAIGSHPMRCVTPWYTVTEPTPLQYRKRISPYAARSLMGLTGKRCPLLQYRKRLSPHAAFTLTENSLDPSVLQYRSRVTPFAAPYH